MSEQQPGVQYERKAPHLTVYLLWPTLLGIVIPLVISGARLGLAWKKSGGKVAFDKASNTFLWIWPIMTVLAFVFVVWQWAGPRVIEAMRQTQVIREKEQTQHHWTRLGGRAAKPTNAPAFSHEVESIEPQADMWVKEAYNVICTLWNQDLTRAAFKRNWPEGGTEMYYRYVAGKGNEKGWFDQWKVIEPADKRGKMRFNCSLDRVLQADDDLWAYATRMRQLSPTPTRRSRARVGG